MTSAHSFTGRNVSYNGTGKTNDLTTPVGGFCQHGSILFPVYHRAFQIQMEKAIRYYAGEIAREYEDPEVRERYIKVANELRLPYWDWASADTMINGVPELFTEEKVPVQLPPNEDPDFIINPLKYYTFVEEITYLDDNWYTIGSQEYRTYKKGEETARHPDPVTKLSNDTLLNSNVRFAAAVTWIPGVTGMYNSTRNFHKFSNHFATTGLLGTQNNTNYGYYPSIELCVIFAVFLTSDMSPPRDFLS